MFNFEHLSDQIYAVLIHIQQHMLCSSLQIQAKCHKLKDQWALKREKKSLEDFLLLISAKRLDC